MLEGGTGPGLHPGPPLTQMCQKPPVSAAARALAPSMATSVPGEHRVPCTSGTLPRAPTRLNRAGHRGFCHPATHRCCAVCKKGVDLFAAPSDVVKHFLTKLGLGSNPFLLLSGAGPCRTAHWGLRVPGSEGLAPNTPFYRIPAHSCPFPTPSTSRRTPTPAQQVKAAVSYKVLWRPQLINPTCN